MERVRRGRCQSHATCRFTLSSSARLPPSPVVGRTLWNLRDGSALIAPAVSISLSDESSARFGVFVPAGPGYDRLAGPQSEYGAVPVTGYAGLSVYF